ncbi:MAG: choice-of-anchor D domain-containing protein, partial [Bacillota bacterium]
MKKILSVISLIMIIFTCSTYGQLNYTFSASSGSFTPLTGASQFTWTAATANDEEYSAVTDLGFTFTYAGTAYTQIQASTNGFIRFGSGLTSATAADALDGVLRQVAAPLWDDLAVGATATDVTYLSEGSAPNRIFTVEWKNVKWNKTTTAANAQFQVKLYEGSNKIEFCYGPMSAPAAGSASIGLSDATTVTAGSATGKFLSINVGGTAGARTYHLSRGYSFNGIINAPDTNTVFTFLPVTPTPIAAGTYTIGGSSPDYKSISEAANALNVNGIAGPVVFNVRPGTYDDIFHIIAVNGTSAANTVTLKNESGVVVLSPKNGSSTNATGAASGDAIIRFDGAQYTTIQGLTLNDNGQATVGLKFEAGIIVGNSALAGAMVSGGRFNHFKDLNIDMKSTTGVNHPGAMGIRFFTTGSSEADTAKGTSYNKIENCNITGFWRSGWKTYGISATNPNRGNSISGCTFGNVNIPTGVGSDVRALEIDCESNVTIENNKIQNIDVAIMTTNNIYGIWFNPAGTTATTSGTIIIRNNQINSLKNSGTGVTTGVAIAIATNAVANNTEFQIYGNKIYDIFSNCSGAGRAGGILTNMSIGTPTTTKIYNNMIYDIRAPRSTGNPGVRGIDVQNGGGNGNFYVYNNTVYLDNAVAPAVTGTNVYHRSACVYWGNFGTANLELKNNILVNTMGTSFTGTGVSVASCLYPSAASNMLRLVSTSDNNLFYAGTPAADRGIAYDAATVYKTMSDLLAIANFAPREANSISVDPTSSFVSAVSPYDVHIAPSSWLVKGQGAPTSLVKNDIDGDLRSSDIAKGPVCIGADEYQPTGKAAAVVSGTIGDGQVSTFTGVDGKQLGEITWHQGTGTLPSAITVSYAPGAQLVPPTGASIYRNYSISATGSATGWNADLKLYYNASTELMGSNEAGLRMYQNTGAKWELLPTTMNTTGHYGTANVTSLSNFTFGDSVAFPVLASAFSMTPKKLAFGGVLKAQTKKDSITVTNTGQAVLVIDSVGIDNSAYTISAKTASINPGASYKFFVTFAPVTEGAKNGNIIFYHNAPSAKDTAAVSGAGVDKYFFAEDFTSAAGTLLTAAGWTQSGTSATAPIAITAPGLVSDEYIASGTGNAATLATTGQDVYASFPSVNSGSVYLAFMLNVASAQTGDYFIALSPTSGQTNYYARLFVKSATNGYQLGISKYNETPAVYGTTTLPFNKTNVVVVKYNFVAADSNDAISVYAFPGNVSNVEPATAEISYASAAKGDPADL